MASHVVQERSPSESEITAAWCCCGALLQKSFSLEGLCPIGQTVQKSPCEGSLVYLF